MARRYLPSVDGRRGFDALPTIVQPEVADRLEGLAKAGEEANRRHREWKRSGITMKRALTAYRELRSLCTYAAEWLPEGEAFAEALSRVVDDHPWADLQRRTVIATALYDLSVLAHHHGDFLAALPGAKEAMVEARQWVDRLRAEERRGPRRPPRQRIAPPPQTTERSTARVWPSMSSECSPAPPDSTEKPVARTSPAM